MAFQQAGGMNGAPGGPVEHHGPQGTEYTLQGVMRYLQIEWHNHERARNAWDIERAEMRAKIAKQEGECRHAKRINEQLDRQVRMLELALRNERKKSGAGLGNNGRAATPDPKTAEPEKKEEVKKEINHVSPGDAEIPAMLEATDKEREQYIDNTTKYLKGCMKEIQYLLTPPAQPPPQQIPLNGNFTGLPDPPLNFDNLYSRGPQRNMRQAEPPFSVAQDLPQQPNTAREPNRGPRFSDGPGAASQGPQESTREIFYQTPITSDNPNAEVRYTPSGQRMQATRNSNEPNEDYQQVDPDGWTFDEEPKTAQVETPHPDGLPRRPDTDLFPSAANASQLPAKSPPRTGSLSHRRKSSGSQAMSRRRSSQGKTEGQDAADAAAASDPSQFKLKFQLRGHLDVVRSVVFTGGGSPSEPEVCTAGDDGTIKRWIIPASYQDFNAANPGAGLDIAAYFTHRGHEGAVTSLATCPASTGFSTGGRIPGDGWIFSGGQDATIRVWERGRVDPKATIDGHTDSIWCVCVLPAPVGAVFGPQSNEYGGQDRLLLVTGSADGTVKVWSVSAPPQTSSPSTGSRRGVGGSRRHSVTSGSNFPSSPQPSVASTTLFGYNLIHSIDRPTNSRDTIANPTAICPLSPSGETFVVSYSDSAILIFDTRTGEMLKAMASDETYDGTMETSINTVVATSLGLEGAGTSALDAARGLETEEVGAGATGGREGVEGVVISGHEDRFVRFFDANSGQCTYTMLAHPSAIAALALSKDGREAASAGHDGSVRLWSLEKRICTQEVATHRPMRGEGACNVAWSQDGRLIVSAGGDGVVKVSAR